MNVPLAHADQLQKNKAQLLLDKVLTAVLEGNLLKLTEAMRNLVNETKPLSVQPDSALKRELVEFVKKAKHAIELPSWDRNNFNQGMRVLRFH
jgi:hypothetical protein